MDPSQHNASLNRELIGEILIRRKRITQEQLQQALKVQKKENKLIGEILIELGYLDERDIVVALVVQCGLPYIAINKYEIPKQILKMIPEKVAREFSVIPLDRVGNVLSVVMANPLSKRIKDELVHITGCKIATFIATKTEISEAIVRWYKRKK